MDPTEQLTDPPTTTDRRGRPGPRKATGGPLAGLDLVLLLLLPSSLDSSGSLTAGIALWMAVWWVLESVSIPVTALLPILLFPAVT